MAFDERDGPEEAPRHGVPIRMRGTTIVPAVVMVLVLAALGWVAVRDPGMCGRLERKARADILAIESACERYAEDHYGVYPDDLERLVEPDATGRKYLIASAVPLDPWRRPYVYTATDERGRPPRIGTFGRDGVPGGKGNDRDVDNRRRSADFDAR